MKYFSNAKWSKIGNSQDEHSHGTDEKNLEFAQSICEQLMNRWGHGARPCEVRGACLKTWVTDESGKEIK